MAKFKKPYGAISEMAIVDFFTKLIFDAGGRLSESEQRIMDGLCLLEGSLTGAARKDISDFLRAATIEEMIALVNKLKVHIDQQAVIAASKPEAIHHLHH